MKNKCINNSIFGYEFNPKEKKLVIDKDEASIVEANFELYGRYKMELYEINSLLNEERNINDIVNERLLQIINSIKDLENKLDNKQLECMDSLYDNIDLENKSKIYEFFNVLIELTKKVYDEDLELQSVECTYITDTKKIYDDREKITFICKKNKSNDELER